MWVEEVVPFTTGPGSRLRLLRFLGEGPTSLDVKRTERPTVTSQDVHGTFFDWSCCQKSGWLVGFSPHCPACIRIHSLDTWYGGWRSRFCGLATSSCSDAWSVVVCFCGFSRVQLFSRLECSCFPCSEDLNERSGSVAPSKVVRCFAILQTP